MKSAKMFTNGMNSFITTKGSCFEKSISGFYPISSLLLCKRQFENEGLLLECMDEMALEHHFGPMDFEACIFPRTLETR